MDKIKAKNNKNKQDSENPYSTTITLEDRLKVLANLIVDRIIEDQQNGTLQRKLAK